MRFSTGGMFSVTALHLAMRDDIMAMLWSTDLPTPSTASEWVWMHCKLMADSCNRQSIQKVRGKAKCKIHVANRMQLEREPTKHVVYAVGQLARITFKVLK